jgi:hypothetical protein
MTDHPDLPPLTFWTAEPLSDDAIRVRPDAGRRRQSSLPFLYLSLILGALVVALLVDYSRTASPQNRLTGNWLVLGIGELGVGLLAQFFLLSLFL